MQIAVLLVELLPCVDTQTPINKTQHEIYIYIYIYIYTNTNMNMHECIMCHQFTTVLYVHISLEPDPQKGLVPDYVHMTHTTITCIFLSQAMNNVSFSFLVNLIWLTLSFTRLAATTVQSMFSL